MKKYIVISFILGFLTCVGCVYAFGSYTKYRIQKMDAEFAEQNRRAIEVMQNATKFKQRAPASIDSRNHPNNN